MKGTDRPVREARSVRSASEQRLRELVHAIGRIRGTSVFLVDMGGLITHASGTEHNHGLPPEALIGRPLTDLSWGKEAADKVGRLFTHVSRGRESCAQRIVDTRDTGEAVPVSLTASPCLGPGGEVTEVVVIWRDLRREEADQHKLLQAAKLTSLGELVAGVAHELNNPLTAVISTADLLEQETEGPVLEDVRAIREHAGRAAEIVRQLVGFVRSTPVEKRGVDLNELVKRVCDFRRNGLAAQGISLRLEVAASSAQVLGDVGQLKQVVLSVLRNAEHALTGHPAGRIRVRTEENRGRVRLVIADNGRGISADALPRLFDPFFTTREVGEGAGLGLAVSHGIVHAHGGTMWVNSTEGRGATVIMELPGVLLPNLASASVALSDGTVSKRVLLADAAESRRRTITRHLRTRGHRVDDVATAEAALHRLERRSYDVVIVDVHLPPSGAGPLAYTVPERWPELLGRVLFISHGESPEWLHSLLARSRHAVFRTPDDLVPLARAVAEMRR